MEDLLSKINWQRIGLNAIAVFCIVAASAWGDDLFLALKAGTIAAVLALGRELQETLKKEDSTTATTSGNGMKISSWLLF